MTRILYITYDGITDPLGQSQVLPYLCGLSAAGYKIHILSVEKKETYSRQKDTIERIVCENDLTWHHIFFSTRPKYISKGYDLWRMRRKAVRLQQQFHFAATHCRSYIAAQAGLMLKRRYDTQFIFDMRGFWVDERIENGQWDPQNIIFRLLIKRYRKIERSLLQSADKIIVLTQKAQEHLVARAGIRPGSISVIPCCVDMNLFDAATVNRSRVSELRSELGIQEQDYLVVYSGSLGTLYLIDETIKVFGLIQKNIPHAKMLILSKITAGQLAPYLLKYGIEETAVKLRWSTRADMPAYLAMSRMALCFIQASFSKIASCPTKLAEYLAMGIPVLVNAGIGDDDDIITSGRCGVVLQNFSGNELEKAIFWMKQYQTPCLAAVDCAQRHYSLAEGIQKYVSVYKTIG